MSCPKKKKFGAGISRNRWQIPRKKSGIQKTGQQKNLKKFLENLGSKTCNGTSWYVIPADYYPSRQYFFLVTDPRNLEFDRALAGGRGGVWCNLCGQSLISRQLSKLRYHCNTPNHRLKLELSKGHSERDVLSQAASISFPDKKSKNCMFLVSFTTKMIMNSMAIVQKMVMSNGKF